MRNKQTQANAKTLRKRLTEAEQRLWSKLRRRQLRGYKFRRQYPVGAYVADFACIEACLVIEVDGGQHHERQEQDAARTRTLQQHGFRVLRFWNNEVLGETESVLAVIADELGRAPTQACQSSNCRGRSRLA